ncbi:hypothetical protein V1478_009669 [Vespula squamosa]|uniref:Uncharacterized protein n=1 Tax=Vespula squamosa TaxID=30214 RepID=A0ABD2AQB8_VESSQ
MTRGAVVVVVVKSNSSSSSSSSSVSSSISDGRVAAPELSAVAEPRLGDTDQRARQAGQASQAVKSIKRSRDGSVPFRSIPTSSGIEVLYKASTSAKAPPAKLYIASEGGLPLMTK